MNADPHTFPPAHLACLQGNIWELQGGKVAFQIRKGMKDKDGGIGGALPQGITSEHAENRSPRFAQLWETLISGATIQLKNSGAPTRQFTFLLPQYIKLWRTAQSANFPACSPGHHHYVNIMHTTITDQYVHVSQSLSWPGAASVTHLPREQIMKLWFPTCFPVTNPCDIL